MNQPKRTGPRMQLLLTVRPELRPSVDLKRRWDKKLSGKWALAPKDLVRMGLVNDRNYRDENRRYGRSVGRVITDEILLQRKELKVDYGQILVYGAGLRREWPWFVRAANRATYELLVYECSQVAARKVRRYFRRVSRGSAAHNEVVYADVVRACGDIEYSSVYMVLALGFLQVQSIEAVQRIMLSLRPFFEQHGRRMVIAHPFLEDNDKPITWNGLLLEKPEWGDSALHSQEDIIAPVKDVLQVVRSDKIRYYHQTYTALALVSSG